MMNKLCLDQNESNFKFIPKIIVNAIPLVKPLQFNLINYDLIKRSKIAKV